MSKDELITGANNLTNSLVGLESFINRSFTSTESITLDDINGLNGLIAAIKLLSEKHAEHAMSYLEDSE